MWSELAIGKGIGYHCLSLGRDTKAGRGTGKFYSGKKGRFQVCPDWRLLAFTSCRWADQKRGIPCDWLGEHI